MMEHEHRTFTFAVTGMDCAGCASSIQDALPQFAALPDGCSMPFVAVSFADARAVATVACPAPHPEELAAAAVRGEIELQGFAALLLVWSLIALTFIDIDTQMLPDDVTLPLIWLGLLVNLQGGFVSLPDAVIGAVAGYLSLWSVYWLFRFATGKEGIGYGDFKLLAALGAWLGWMMLPLIVLLSSAVGALVGVAMIVLRGHQRDKPIPFGPFLAVAGLIALLYGETLVQLWLGQALRLQ